MFFGKRDDCGHVRAIDHGADRVGGRVDQERFGFRRDQPFEIVDLHDETVRFIERIEHGFRADDLRAHCEIRPTGVGQQNLIARIEDRSHARVERLDTAGRHDDLIAHDRIAVAGAEFLDERIAQFGDPGVRRVLRLTVLGRVVGRLHDMRRRGEIRLAGRGDNRPRGGPGKIHNFPDTRARNGSNSR